jgi:hypothetical protein
MMKSSGKRARGEKRIRGTVDRSYESDHDINTTSEEEDNDRERGATKKRKYGRNCGRGLSWSLEEDRQLKKLREEDEVEWEEIAGSFPGRSKQACQQRYSTRINEGEKRLGWTKEETLQLQRLREEDELKWDEIAKSFPGRSMRSCEIRYNNYVNEGARRAHVYWTKEGILLLKKLRDEDGMTFKEIAKSFPGRSMKTCQLKHRNYGKEEGEKQIHVAWTKEEYTLLKKLRGGGWNEIQGDCKVLPRTNSDFM